VYLDLYFLVNLWMNLLILDLTQQLLKLPGSKKRLLAAAVTGAGTACALAVAGWYTWRQRWLCGIPCAACMTGIAYGRASASECGRRMAVLLLSGMILAGGMSLLTEAGFDGWLLLLSGMLVIAFARYLREMLRAQRAFRNRCCQVRLEYRGSTVQIPALIDTGNLLYEPYGHQPVHIITAAPVRKLCRSVSQVLYLPYRSVGQEQGVLPVIRIDQMTVEQEGRPPVRYDRPWLGISPHPLSSSHRYEMLLHIEEW
jgi:stage II sporulation protein GA (sporulation sigma-E factor processing peptidase)